MRGKLVLLASVSALLTAGTALAETDGAAPAAAAAAPNQGSQLEEIVVTARRREEVLQDVPLSVTALTAGTLAKAGVSDVRMLTFVVPAYNGGRNFTVFLPTIRGVSSNGNTIGDEANVALYIDGVYQPHPAGNITDFVEVDRVEVLRGPQGTLFGRNATGGLINIITPDPSFQTFGHLAAEYAEFHSVGDVNLRGYVTGKISDSLAGDLAIIYRENPGYIKNLTGGAPLGALDALSVRGKLLYKPSDSVKAVLTLAYARKRDNSANSVEPLNGNTIGNAFPAVIEATRPYEAALNLRPVARVETYNASLRTSFDLSSVLLETTTGYYRDKTFQITDTDASPVAVNQNDSANYIQALSQEIRLLSKGDGKLQWIAGVYGFHTWAHSYADLFSGVAPTYTRLNNSINAPHMLVTSYAGFGEGTYKLTDSLKLTLGARYTTEEREWTPLINNVAPFPTQKHSENRWTYRSSLQYAFSEHGNAYVTYSTGFKSGVFNAIGTDRRPTRPETISSIEGGVKMDPTPWLRTNFSVFDYKYDDLQVTARDLATNTYLLINAARASIRGAELEINAVPTDHLRFTFSGSLLDAKYDSFPNAQVFVPIAIPGTALFKGSAATTQDVSGNYLLRAPRYTVSLMADWTHNVNGGAFDANATLFHSAQIYYDFGNRLRQPEYTLLNAEASWQSPDNSWKFRVFGRNLTNTRVIMQANATAPADQVTYERPITVGAGIDYRF